MDLKLAEILKANLHILLNIDFVRNKNKLNGKCCVPQNQLVRLSLLCEH